MEERKKESKRKDINKRERKINNYDNMKPDQRIAGH
jgi:hypothetical protein